jgi:FixJ family two-component response regulator
MSSKPVILCVDDERNVVESMQLNLRKHYVVQSAFSPAAGLALLHEHPDTAVVISDMRMPEMDGAAFLSKVKEVAPTAVRMLLTGYSDIDAAMRAVNEGQIFRFLAKPCTPEHLLATVAAGVEQHRLITAERVLLQKTLLGCVKALIEVLALSNPMALGRAVRIRDKVRGVAKQLGLDQPWRLEFAALLSQLGAVSLPDETIKKLYDGEPLDEIEQWKLVQNMETINKILGNIPRLGPVTGLLAGLTAVMRQEQRDPDTEIPLEVRILHAALDLDTLEAQGLPLAETLAALRSRESAYGAQTLAAIEALQSEPEQRSVTVVSPQKLDDGMVLCEDLKTRDGILILPRGFAVNQSSREHIANFYDRLPATPISVLAPADEAREGRSAEA